MGKRNHFRQMKCLNLNNWRTIFLQLHIFPEKMNSRHFSQVLYCLLLGRLAPLDGGCSCEVIQGHKGTKLTGKGNSSDKFCR